MIKILINSQKNKPLSLIGLDKRAAMAIQRHFGMTNFQIVVLSWFKGLWTGILVSLVLHYYIIH